MTMLGSFAAETGAFLNLQIQLTVILEHPAVSRSTAGIIIHLSRAMLKPRANLLRAAAAELFLRESCP